MDGLPRLPLLPLIEAAHAMLLAGALPSPPGISLHRLACAGGMRPWLRLAFGDTASRPLEADPQGRGGWCLPALMGGDGAAGKPPLIGFDRDEAHALLAVDALCEAASWPAFATWSLVCDRVPLGLARTVAPLLEAAATQDGTAVMPAGPAVADALDGIAARFGLAPRRRPAGLSAWRERVLTGTVGRMAAPPAGMFLQGGSRGAFSVALDDGTEAWVGEADAAWPGGRRPDYGARLRLTWCGATAGHPGYLSRVAHAPSTWLGGARPQQARMAA